jgi:hypothetical protein
MMPWALTAALLCGFVGSPLVQAWIGIRIKPEPEPTTAPATQPTSQPATVPESARVVLGSELSQLAQQVGTWQWQRGQLWLRPYPKFFVENLNKPLAPVEGILAAIARTPDNANWMVNFNQGGQSIIWSWQGKPDSKEINSLVSFTVHVHRPIFVPPSTSINIAHKLEITPNLVVFTAKQTASDGLSKPRPGTVYRYSASNLLSLLQQQPELRKTVLMPMLEALAGPDALAPSLDAARLALLPNGVTAEDKTALADLVIKLDDANQEIRDVATNALGGYGPHALAYLKTLEGTKLSFEQRDRIKLASAQLLKRFPPGMEPVAVDPLFLAGALLVNDPAVAQIAADRLRLLGGEKLLTDFNPKAPRAQREVIFWQLIPLLTAQNQPTTQPQPAP